MDYLPDFPDPLDTARVLADAARHLVRIGWTQDDDRACRDDACVFLAIRRAAPSDALFFAARDALAAHLDVRCIVDWNAEPGRTQDQAVAALRGASEVLRFETAVLA